MTRTTASPRADSSFRLPDGRRVAYAEWGEPGGRPVVLLHGMPGSRLICPDVDAAVQAGVRLVTVDRPGYGGSDPRPGLTLKDWVDDYAALCDELDLAPCPLLGWSGGAAYALAVGFHRPERVTHLALLAGAGPVDEVPDAWASTPDSDRLVVETYRVRGTAARPVVLEDCRQFSDDPTGFLRPGEGDLAGRPDLHDALATMFREAAAQGPIGQADDVIAQCALGWGFSPADVTVPVEVWWGERDQLVPRADADYFATHLPDGRLHVVPGVGHGMPAHRFAEILASVGVSSAPWPRSTT
jgi:pimeloyl-ACP methyl ester carboxylesterase